MSLVFMKKLKSIFRINSKKFKRIIFFWLIVVWLILLFSPNVTYASSLFSSFEDQLFTQNISGLIKMISHVVYVFIRPCLVIAGTALDNSLVFGKFLHLDAALWNIWNIMKNFANFTLWFVFIFTIVVNLFKWALEKADPMKNAKDTVTATLVAWVLIQMSWFLVAVLIDLSTILIVSIWGLPLSMIQSYNKDVAEVPVMKMNVEITNDESYYYYSYWWHNFAPCLLINKEWDVDENIIVPNLDWEYIAWRKRLYLSSWVKFDEWYCTLNWYLYHYEESTGFFANEGTWHYEETWNTLEEINTNYYNNLKQYLDYVAQNTGLVEEEKNSCFLISAYGTDYDGECNQVCSWYWDVPYSDDIFTKTTDKFTLQELMEKSKWWVWPFVTMYSSILNYQDLVMNPGSGSVMWNLFGFIINTFFALVLFIPILILAVLLIIRIWYLWVVVAISPILVLVHTFTKLGGDWPFKSLSGKDWFKKLFAKFGVKEIMTQIFSPVIVVFAVSLCIIFLSTIYKTKPEKDQASSTLSAFWIECVEVKDDDAEGDWNSNSCENADNAKQNKKCDYSILWLVTIRLNAQNYNHWKDMFVWVLMELLATWIVWFFMKFAIWMMWEKWKKLMDSAQEFVASMPVVPLPGGHGYVWLNKIWQIWPTKLLDSVSSEMSNKSDEILKKRFPWAYGIDKKDSNSESEPVSSEAVKKVHTYIEEHKDVTFATLPTEHKETLAKLYWQEVLTENNYNTFVEYHKDADVINTGASVNTSPTTAKTNADALMFSKAQMDRAIRSDPNWKAWARWMVAWSVQTSDWVFMVDYLGGTAVPWNQQYEIVTRELYEERHFPAATLENGMQSITKNDYEKYNDDQKKALDEHFKQIEEELNELERIKKKRENGTALEWNEELVESSISKNLHISSDDLKKLKESLWIS